MSDYHRYYGSSECDQSLFDISLIPFFEYLHIKNGERSIFSYGGFVSAQFNWNQFWIRAYDNVGQVVEKQDGREDCKATGADDVIVKIGYDFCRDDEKHFGLYALAGFPTNRNLKSQTTTTNGLDLNLTIDSPAMGGKNFTVGGGLTGAYTLYDCNTTRVAFLFDSQYSYVIPATYANTKVTKLEYFGTWQLSPLQIDSDIYQNIDTRVTFTPGHSIDNWLALHAAFNNKSVEFGGKFKTDFGSQAALKCDNEKDLASFREAFEWHTPALFLSVKPYVAFSYSFDLLNCPTLIGLGAAYNYNELLREQRIINDNKPNVFHGLDVWVTLGLSF